MTDPTHIDIARLGSPGEIAQELTYLLLALVREQGGSVELRPEDLGEHGDVLLIDRTAEGRISLKVEARAQQDPRVPAGGWIHVISGMAVHVGGISHEGLVIVKHQHGEPGEHRADQPIEEFLKSHVPVDAVPFIGGDA